jgi:holliday junction DNA helicase RuvB
MSRKFVSIPAARSAESLARMQAEGERAERTYRLTEERIRAMTAPQSAATPTILLRPVDTTSPNREDLRPTTLDATIGQERLKPLLARLVGNARTERRPLAPLLFVGASGTGKTTLSMVVAHELGQRIFNLKAPLDTNTLMALRSQARDLDVVFIDEIHMQVSGDRRGITGACDPEAFYALLEDGVLSTPTGPLPFPKVSWIGATTDVGLLPEPLSSRFPLQPQLAPYDASDMARMAAVNMGSLGLDFGPGEHVPQIFADASRGNPRQLNAYVRAARALADGPFIDAELAREVIIDLESTTLDGLSKSMQTVLTFLYRHCRRETKQGITYSASVNTLATACGHGRDTKAISLLVEPYLLQRGLLEVRSQGRTLTPAGIERARLLIGG